VFRRRLKGHAAFCRRKRTLHRRSRAKANRRTTRRSVLRLLSLSSVGVGIHVVAQFAERACVAASVLERSRSRRRTRDAASAEFRSARRVRFRHLAGGRRLRGARRTQAMDRRSRQRLRRLRRDVPRRSRPQSSASVRPGAIVRELPARHAHGLLRRGSCRTHAVRVASQHASGSGTRADQTEVRERHQRRTAVSKPRRRQVPSAFREHGRRRRRGTDYGARPARPVRPVAKTAGTHGSDSPRRAPLSTPRRPDRGLQRGSRHGETRRER